MPDISDWLSGVVVINESKDEAVAGDIHLYRSEADACRSLEGWWVENQEGFAFSAAGERLVLGVDASGQVVVDRREPCPEGRDIVTSWLQSYARFLFETRQYKAAERRIALSSAEQDGVLPSSIEGLVAYIGFETEPEQDWVRAGCMALLLVLILLAIVLAGPGG